MKVKAKQLGYYNHKRVKEGSIIHLESPSHFSKVWMEKLEDKAVVASAKAAPSKGPAKKKEEVLEVEKETDKQVI